MTVTENKEIKPGEVHNEAIQTPIKTADVKPTEIKKKEEKPIINNPTTSEAKPLQPIVNNSQQIDEPIEKEKKRCT